MSKRATVAAILDRAGVFGALLAARSRLVIGSRVPVLVYHCVHEAGPGYLWDDGVVDASPAQLDEQMQVVAKYFHPVGIDDLIANQQGGKLPRNAIVVTFDDGYRNNHDIALPILQRHGVKGVFFMSTRYIEERRLFWWDRISYLLKTSTRDQLSLSYPYPLELDLAHDRKRAVGKCLRIVKDHFGLDIERFLGQLAEQAGVAWDRDRERRFADELIMTWDHVRALRDAGMDVESHTATHRVLQTCTPEEARAELVGSRRELEDKLGVPVRAVSYPCGRSIEDAPAIVDEVRRAGYTLGFSAYGGVSSPHDRLSKPLHLQRLPLDSTVTLPLFRGMLALPQLAGRF